MSVVVYGSLNADTVLEVEHFPLAGETIRGTDVNTGPGGKGLNQAVAAGRVGAHSVMVGAIGSDGAADMLQRALAGEENLFLARVARLEASTGQAFVTVDASAENTIVIIAGANGTHTPASAGEQLDFLTDSDVLVCQLEVPLDAVASALATGRGKGAYTILNAAPAADVRDMLAHVNLLVVNETEAAAVLADFGHDLPSDPEATAALLHEAAGVDVVVTLGGKGLTYRTSAEAGTLPAYPITAVDTTGAGDAFVGALAAQVAAGVELEQALRYASAVGAIACRYTGAQGYEISPDDVAALMGA